MTDKAETTAAGKTSTNSAAPDPVAAAEPCGCAERIDALDNRMHLLEMMSRSVGWMSVAVAFAVVYLMWAGAGSGSKDAAAK